MPKFNREAVVAQMVAQNLTPPECVARLDQVRV
jgi:hypothetical protein